MSAVSEVDRKVAAALGRAGLAAEGATAGNRPTIVIGVSGGADSSTLLYSLNRLKDGLGFNLHVAHLNHDFRGEEADEDARFVEALAHELGLPVSVEKRDPIAYQQERHISSFEQGAREMRYEFMAGVAHRVGAPAVAVGHTSDDLAETVLLHILRGTGLPGLRGMVELASWPWPTGLDSPALFRPLLEVSKTQTVHYCNELDRDYRQDSGNTLFRFTRNRVRQDLLPLLVDEYNPRVRDALVRLAHSSSLELDYLEQELDAVWGDIVVSDYFSTSRPQPTAGLALSAPAISQLHPALRRIALRRAYVAVKGDSRRLRENHIKAMSELVEGSATGKHLNLPGGLMIYKSGPQVILAAGPSADPGPYPDLSTPLAVELPVRPGTSSTYHFGSWEVSLAATTREEVPSLRTPNGFSTYLMLENLGNAVSFRGRREGDRFQPLGMAGTKKLKDFFTDTKAPREWRDRIPLVVADRGIAWIVGYRIAEWAKVPLDCPPETPLLALSFQRESDSVNPEPSSLPA